MLFKFPSPAFYNLPPPLPCVDRALRKSVWAVKMHTKLRWTADSYRFPPYTYQEQFCLTDGATLRVAGPAEREILMGFLPGHTAVKVKSWSRVATPDERSAAIGNSFHTGVVANILRDGLKPFLKSFRFPDPTMINLQFQAEVRECQQEIYSARNTRKTEKLDDWMERLERDDPIPAMPLRVEFTSRSLIIHRMMELLTYRGTDVHPFIPINEGPQLCRAQFPCCWLLCWIRDSPFFVQLSHSSLQPC